MPGPLPPELDAGHWQPISAHDRGTGGMRRTTPCRGDKDPLGGVSSRRTGGVPMYAERGKGRRQETVSASRLHVGGYLHSPGPGWRRTSMGRPVNAWRDPRNRAGSRACSSIEFGSAFRFHHRRAARRHPVSTGCTGARVPAGYSGQDIAGKGGARPRSSTGADPPAARSLSPADIRYCTLQQPTGPPPKEELPPGS